MILLLFGFALAALVGALGWKFGALTRGGAAGATLIGGLVFGLGGPTWGAILVAFFISSSLLSHFRANEKSSVTANFAKTSRRDFKQTLANGGLAAILAVLVGIVTHESPWYPTLTLAYFGALSAAAADTWATEIGLLSSQAPRSIIGGTELATGQSGGITKLGLLASIAGGLFIGASAFTLIQLASLLTTGEWFLQDWFLLPICAIAGFLGSAADSLLGATLQRTYYCEHCQAHTERAIHTCGSTTRPEKGLSGMDNDVVNFLATVAGALTAITLSPLFL